MRPIPENQVHFILVNPIKVRIEQFLIVLMMPFIIKNFWDFILDFLGQKKGRYILFLWNGSKLILRSGTTDKAIFNEIFFRKIYTRIFNFSPNDIVVDVGAHIGIFTVFIAKKVKRVICFEPEKENFKLLKENLALNGLKNVLAFNLGLGEKNKSERIFLFSTNLGMHSAFIKTNKSFLAKIRPIDFIFSFAKNVDFLKMDCEGCEYKTLVMAKKTILQKIKKMAIEYHRIGSFNEKIIIEKLKINKFITFSYPIFKDFGIIYAYRLEG